MIAFLQETLAPFWEKIRESLHSPAPKNGQREQASGSSSNNSDGEVSRRVTPELIAEIRQVVQTHRYQTGGETLLGRGDLLCDRG